MLDIGKVEVISLLILPSNLTPGFMMCSTVCIEDAHDCHQPLDTF